MEKDKKKKKKNVLQRYNDAETKKNIKHTGMKTGVDAVLGTSTGAGLAAVFGIWSPLVGVILIGAGHYFGDKSGLLRVSGAATIAYGIAKASENRAAVDDASVNGVSLGSVADGAKQRLIDFKNNWLKAFYLDKLTKEKETATDDKKDATVGAIDLSELDSIEEMVKESAIQFELKNIKEEDDFDEDEFEEDEDFEEDEFEQENEELEGLNFALIEEEIDFNSF